VQDKQNLLIPSPEAGRVASPSEGEEGTERERHSACIRDIKLHGKASKYLREALGNQKDHWLFGKSPYFDDRFFAYLRDKNRPKTDFKEILLVYPNMVELRPVNKITYPEKRSNPGRKGNVTEFSYKSRKNFIKRFCKIISEFRVWLDLTFADDVMQVKTVVEKKIVSNKALNRFRRVFLREYEDYGIVYKREWMKRKSGELIGDFVPHFHTFLACPSLSENELFDLAKGLARIWVEATKTEQTEKALSVAIHKNSYRLIADRDQAIKYATKYVTKPGEFQTDESIGRSWGTIGKIEIGKAEIMELTPAEAKVIRKQFSQEVPEKCASFRESLLIPESATFLIIKRSRTNEIIESVSDWLEQESMSFFDERIEESLERGMN
jgi:hypothetical protein